MVDFTQPLDMSNELEISFMQDAIKGLVEEAYQIRKNKPKALACLTQVRNLLQEMGHSKGQATARANRMFKNLVIKGRGQA